MSNRFHTKWHRRNHHTYGNSQNPDASFDPIASPAQPFLGDFSLQGALCAVAPLSSYAAYLYTNNMALCAFAGQVGIYVNAPVGVKIQSSNIGLSSVGNNIAGVFYSPTIALSTVQPFGDGYPNRLTPYVGPNYISKNVFNNRVGIFTENPLSAFHVTGGSYFDGHSNITGNLSVNGDLSRFDTNVLITSSTQIILQNNVSQSPALLVSNTGQNYVLQILSPSNYPALIVDGNSSRPGWVGVGTLLPNNPLTVVGTISGSQRLQIGYNVTASGLYSSVAGGQNNNASGPNSNVAGGNGNNASTYFSNVAGGNGNNASGNSSNVAGGYNNNACGDCSTVSGGIYNCATGQNTAIVAGQCNCDTAGNNNFIGSGYCNYINQNNSSIVGGSNNTIYGIWSFIAGGRFNTASGASSNVAGGQSNTASECYSNIAGGRGNNACRCYSNVAGGQINNASGASSNVAGGQSNNASGCYSNVAGGIGNTASGGYSSILGGHNNNTNNQTDSFILGSNLTAFLPNYTYTNNISAAGYSRNQYSVTDSSFNNRISTNGNDKTLAVQSNTTVSGYVSLQNLFNGVSASTDLSIFNNNNAYVDLGINSTGYNGSLYSSVFTIASANDAYLFSNATANNLAIGTANISDLVFFTGGTLSGVRVNGGNEALRIKSSGKVGLGVSNPSEVLTVFGNISGNGAITSTKGFTAGDRFNSTNYSVFYRANDKTKLYDSIYGDVL